MTALLQYFDELEIELCLRINRFGRQEALRGFFSVVSRLGDGGYWVLMALVGLVLRGAQAMPLILQTAATATVGLLIYKLLKARFVRERPYIANVGIRCGTPPLDRYSFPSGHTLHAVSFTILFSHFEPVLLLATAPFAVLVAVSRILLGLHYPSDVLVGAAIGAALAATSLAL